MANKPANAGSNRGQPPPGDTAPWTAASPLGETAPRAAAPRTTAGHRAARPRDSAPGVLGWVPYLIVLAGVAYGLATVWERHAAHGAELIGGSLLAAGLARLLLPSRLGGLLSSRRKASDVLAFTVFGAGVLAVALLLP
jgi:hypothetical protein